VQDAEAPQPTLDELQMFRNRKNDPDESDDGPPWLFSWACSLPSHTRAVATTDDEDDIMQTVGANTGSQSDVPLRRGDNVVVVKGDLLHLQGRVVSVNEGRRTFILKSTDPEVAALGVDEFEMPMDEVVKFFHVRLACFVSTTGGIVAHP